jgi:integrase
LRKLLKVIDRTSPRGKRDYAILLLASRLGLRSGDIRTLKLDDLQWDTATIEIRQSKTGGPLCLPMSEDIGKALIHDYLQGRQAPDGPHREVFLRAKAAFIKRLRKLRATMPMTTTTVQMMRQEDRY